VEVWNIMKFKIILLLASLLLFLSHPALSGVGCGTNWLGSDVNDPDFYVSKNQNLGADSGLETPAGSTSNGQLSTTEQPIKIGQLAKADSATIISSLQPDKPSPQGAGTTITWTAAANQRDLLYRFFLKGPATNDQLISKTNWTANNVWIWNTTASDIGDSQIEVQVRDGKHAGPDSFDDHKDASFTIVVSNSGNTAMTSSLNDINPHPSARTADSIKDKPRLAPDERPLQPLTSGNPNGPNMSMPDPNPKPLKSATSSDEVDADTSNSKSSEPAPADVGGKWLVSLDKSGESMDLILIQTGTSIIGSGNLGGETNIPLTASGSIDNENLKLNVKTVVGKYVNQIDKHYDMDLKLADGALSGSYQAYSGDDSIGKGRVTATRQGA